MSQNITFSSFIFISILSLFRWVFILLKRSLICLKAYLSIVIRSPAKHLIILRLYQNMSVSTHNSLNFYWRHLEIVNFLENFASFLFCLVLMLFVSKYAVGVGSAGINITLGIQNARMLLPCTTRDKYDLVQEMLCHNFLGRALAKFIISKLAINSISPAETLTLCRDGNSMIRP